MKLAVLLFLCWADGADPAAYESFFRQVVQMKALSDLTVRTQLNGVPATATLVPKKLQDVVGLTDSEANLVNAAAAECVARLNALRTPSSLAFESLMQQIESGKVSDSLDAQLKELGWRRTQAVLDDVERLRIALGEDRFQILNDYVRSGRGRKELMPALPMTKQ
jgi:hypothetical protein